MKTPIRQPHSGTNFFRLSLAALRTHSLRAVTLLAWLGLAAPALAAESVDDPFAASRQRYVEAQRALASGNQTDYEQLLPALHDYPLLPYLEHAELAARLDSLPEAEVAAFLQRHAGTVLASRLERQWLETLAAQEQWPALIRFYNPANATTALSCLALNARLQSGDQSVFAEVAALWNVPRSQPNACDPLFAAWQAAGHLSPALAWERFSKSLVARQTSLASYLARQLPPREQALADTWLQVDQQPELLQETARFSGSDPELIDMLHHGLQRLAQNNAALAWDLAGRYQAMHQFEPQAHTATRRFIALRLLLQGQIATAETALLQDPALPSEALIEWLLRDALKQEDWQRFDRWISLLPETALATERWRYWRARSLAQRNTAEAAEEARALHEGLALTRSFYGFLAADLLGRNYELVDRPVLVSEAELAALAQQPAMQRAYELFRLGDEDNALREWQHSLRGVGEQQMLSAGKLAERWDWHRNGIQALIQVSYWDDLQLRFPLAYQELVTDAARQHGALDSTFVYAIARQESAFIHDARSSAGALGLMQLMPATARETASAAGLRLNGNQDILKPEVNIALGSRYLAKMLQDFGGNRILAAAAYNAGPSRVRQWLNQDSMRRLPFDIWIETIPFTETRGYVQNVLAYAVIYGYRMGAAVPMLTEEEVSGLF